MARERSKLGHGQYSSRSYLGARQRNSGADSVEVNGPVARFPSLTLRDPRIWSRNHMQQQWRSAEK